MKPEVLTALTAAKGVPFEGKGATTRELAEMAGWFQPGRSAGGTYQDGKVRWNLPKGDRVAKAPKWSLAECAMACKGLDERAFHAVRFEYALDDSVFFSLHRHLLKYARRERKLQNWPATVVLGTAKSDYLPLLAAMWLLEVRQPWRFLREEKSPTPSMWRVLMGCNRHTWGKQLEPIYETVADEYRRWVAIGVGHMRKRLSES